jgi:glucosamine-6-phosphate deaminase
VGLEYIHAADVHNLGHIAARFVAREILVKPDAVLGLPTGSTPIGMYQALVRMANEELISFSQIRTFNLDEYVGLDPTHPQSYAYFMKEHLWNFIDLPPESAEIPQGNAADLMAECRRYDEKLEQAEGIDLQILGLGFNGHIGFNEPSHNLHIRTHVVDLTPETLATNARFFPDLQSMPKQAITMGIGSIMQAKKILLLVMGEPKRDILRKTLFGPVSTEVPASILQLHADLTVLTDIALNPNGEGAN